MGGGVRDSFESVGNGKYPHTPRWLPGPDSCPGSRQTEDIETGGKIVAQMDCQLHHLQIQLVTCQNELFIYLFIHFAWNPIDSPETGQTTLSQRNLVRIPSCLKKICYLGLVPSGGG